MKFILGRAVYRANNSAVMTHSGARFARKFVSENDAGLGLRRAGRAGGFSYVPPAASKPASEMIGAFTKDQMLQILARQTEAGNALVTAGLVEDWLQKLLLAAGREDLTNDDASRLFDGPMGPLKSFSNKIEISYMLNLIDKQTRKELRLIKKIRNNFAHSSRFVSFGTEHIAKDCRELSTWRKGESNEACYRASAVRCINTISAKMDELMYANAISAPPEVSLEDEA
ncbi:hypothetical protein ACVIHI_004914 [Bradyrhizobium sp. USDA 4524]|uniref:hypothetical protein n=1 Tax=unclassified Bradyrhizobium TaxID=2631580 RepID=UPI00209DF181|nr:MULTISPECIES: hypothetical protein [unclassified Bradyrhizobium]MCP1842168.1 hypothetical protein [Bradyrhizobium sp. USDA 4538]MCP1902732.1 hypothetical protein [Bradyrhizobium sp. USDA 4537]MCP1991611.1 hypothetical protein [Bradyrhizobium sp. USDA 4539]